jgi:hypothetical protein
MMGRYISAILCILLLSFAVSTVNASIVSWNCGADGDGAIVMDYGTTTLTPVGNEYQLSMSGDQYWLPAHLQGDFTTDTQLDPTVRIIEDIGNDTTFDWTDYHITIGMSHTFSFVSSGLLAPAGWTAVVTPVTTGLMPNGGPMGYVGTVNYYQSAGDAIVIGDTGTFGFKVSFLGSTTFSTEQIPTPEPTTILLLGLGAMSVIRRSR